MVSEGSTFLPPSLGVTQSLSNEVLLWALFYETEYEIWAGWGWLGSLKFMIFLVLFMTILGII